MILAADDDARLAAPIAPLPSPAELPADSPLHRIELEPADDRGPIRASEF